MKTDSGYFVVLTICAIRNQKRWKKQIDLIICSASEQQTHGTRGGGGNVQINSSGRWKQHSGYERRGRWGGGKTGVTGGGGGREGLSEGDEY